MDYYRDTVAQALVDLGAKRDVPLSDLVSFRVGGPAASVLQPKGETELCRALDVCRTEHIPVVLLGNGTNVLPTDEGFCGLVLHMSGDDAAPVFEGGRVTVGAGYSLTALAKESVQRGFMGLERLCGIPGTVGGALAMNAGSRDEWIGSAVRDVVVARPGAGLARLSASDIEWGYRYASFAPDDIILEATFDLVPGEKDKIARRMEALLKRRRLTQPVGVPTCGSVFKNPRNASVGSLIDGCGLKGRSAGGARISTVHANFIVNEAGATADDVCALMQEMHDRVLKAHGIALEPEVRFLGFGA